MTSGPKAFNTISLHYHSELLYNYYINNAGETEEIPAGVRNPVCRPLDESFGGLINMDLVGGEEYFVCL
jgi:hypothetical protein